MGKATLCIAFQYCYIAINILAKRGSVYIVQSTFYKMENIGFLGNLGA